MLESGPIPTAGLCGKCGTELASNLLSCPSCGWLVHAGELKRLAAEAQSASTPVEALALWRSALSLLPTGTQQGEVILAKIHALDREVEGVPVPATPPGSRAPSKSRIKGIAGLLAVVLGLLVKFKFLVVALLLKGKLLLLGLTKMSTVFSMFISLGVYWSLWGWKFAAGFVLSIYIHEMGHVWMLSRYGIRASAPMFIPGLGAIVRLRESITTGIEDARVGLAGPWWGLGAALLAWGLSLAVDSPMLAAIARVGAWINLFNLTPVWQLDGSRAFRALSQSQRWIAAGVVLGAFFATSEHMLLLVLAVAVYRAFSKVDAAPHGDTRTLIDYAFLIIILSALTLVAPAI